MGTADDKHMVVASDWKVKQRVLSERTEWCCLCGGCRVWDGSVYVSFVAGSCVAGVRAF
jgi:hypothetical protein